MRKRRSKINGVSTIKSEASVRKSMREDSRDVMMFKAKGKKKGNPPCWTTWKHFWAWYGTESERLKYNIHCLLICYWRRCGRAEDGASIGWGLFLRSNKV